MKKTLGAIVSIILLLLVGCSASSINCEAFAGTYRAFVLSDSTGTAHDDRTLGLENSLYLTIQATSEITVDLYDFTTNSVVSLTGTVSSEVNADTLKEKGIDLTDKENADHYYEVEFTDGGVCYIGCWLSGEVIEVFYNGGQCTFLPETHYVFDVTTIEDVLGEEGVYCLHADGSISKVSPVKEYDKHGIILGGAEPLVIDRSAGDQLIYIGDMVYFGYSNPDTFEMDWSVEKYYWSGETVDFFDIEEFEGIDIKGMFTNAIFLKYDTEEIFAPLGFIVEPLSTGYDGEVAIISKEEKEYTYGYFEGTEWHDTTVVNDVPYYDYFRTNGAGDDYVFSAPVIKGKDGYFTIDLSKVDAGLYLNDFDSGSYDVYVFDIR